MSNPATMLPPGFRFHPTDEELILHYLKNRAASLPCPVSIIADVDIYKFDPWDLPAKAIFGEREWYFFTPRDRKYPNGVRPNRAAVSGYWKATGTDKPIIAGKGNKNIGVKKALVFYKGRAPRGLKTGWIMHEFRITEAHNLHDTRPIKLKDSSMRLDDWVLCRIYKKSSSLASMEDSAGEDGYLSNLANTTQQNSNSGLKMQKSSSLAELLDSVDYSLLSRMFDNPSELVEFKQGHQGYPSSSQPSINNLFQQPSQRESPVLMDENCPKRWRVVDGCLEEGGGGLLQPLKKQSNSSIWSNSSYQFDGMQNNLQNPDSINQQRLLNSHLGLGLHGPHM